MMLVDQLRWSFRNIHIEESAVISFISVSVIYSVADPNPDHPDPHVFGLLEPNPNPDPLVRGLDPRIRIHTKMLWIRNTGFFLM